MRNELSDGTIILRRHRPEHGDLIYEAVMESLNELITWMRWCNSGYSRDEAVKRSSTRDVAWDNGEEFCFLIFEKETGKTCWKLWAE